MNGLSFDMFSVPVPALIPGVLAYLATMISLAAAEIGGPQPRILSPLDGDSCLTLAAGGPRSGAGPVPEADPGRIETRGEIGTPPTRRMSLTHPQEFSVTQRARRDGGPVRIAGRLGEPFDAEASLTVRLVARSDDRVVVPWQPAAEIPPGDRAFDAAVDLPAGGWFRLEARLVRGDEILAEAQVARFGVGEVFVVAGQSNSANHGEERLESLTRRVAAFSGERWQIADDPQPGASGSGGSFIPPFADAMAARLQVPIGIIAVGAGGTSVREWLPEGSRFPNPPTLKGNVSPSDDGTWESKGALFANLVARTKPLGPRGFRAVLWHQGESDANQEDPLCTLPGALYRSCMEDLIQAFRRQIGWDAPWFVAQATYHTHEDRGSEDIRSAQASLWKSGIALEGPDTDALGPEFREADGTGVHFNARGLEAHGMRWAEKVGPWIEAREDP